MEQISEAEISMVLDTFMYLEYKQAAEGTSIRGILGELEKLPDYQEGGRYYGEYSIIKQAAENDAVGDLVIGNQSVNMGYDSGTAACTFATPDSSTVYVVYRGTGDGEWPDNGIGLCSTATIQQERALAYFEEVVETIQPDSSQRLVVTGHSKGGNKAQFVTMETKYQDKIDACYSVDGQGFSPEAIERWQDQYGEKEYAERTGKIKGIHGENDYVSALGKCIIAAENIRYVRTFVERDNFAGYHDIKYMFAELEENPVTGKEETVFRGRKNQDAPGRGILGNYAAELSLWVMAVPAGGRDGCAAVVMQVMESLQGSKKGLNGEKLKLSDLSDFTLLGIPVIVDSLVWGERGRGFLGALIKGKDFVDKLQGNLCLEVDVSLLHQWGGTLEGAAKETAGLSDRLLAVAGELPSYLKGGLAIYRQLRTLAESMQKAEKQVREITDAHEKIELSYKKWQQQAVETVMAAGGASRDL